MQSEQQVSVALTLSLPESLAREAEERGLLSSDAIAQLLRERLRQRRVDDLFESATRLSQLNLPSLSESEIEAEIEAVRAERRRDDASGS